MKTVAVIGAGRIGGPVIRWIEDSHAYRLGAVLTRAGDSAAFHRAPADLVLELAGPDALRVHGPDALARAVLWTVSGAALADAALYMQLEAIGRHSGHHLRVLGGAVAGLDGFAAADEAGTTLELSVSRPGGPDASGTVREVALAHPGEANFAMAAALAGPGPDTAALRLAEGSVHRIGADAVCGFGQVTSACVLDGSGLHPVAAAVIAALRRETQVIRAG